MPITIGSNIASLSAQRQLDRSSSALGSVFERLSSGQRINKASDDAAGLSIATSLGANRRVFTQGIRNLNDGLSVLAIADSAIAELTSIVTRQQELATQAATGTYGAKQRKALDTEAQALSDEYLRIARSTSFNGMQIFDGSISQLNLQGGFGTNGMLSSTLGGKMGDGTFTRTTVLNTDPGDLPQEVAATDINNDGILDLITANSAPGADAINVFIGNADGSYKAPVGYGSGVNARTMSTQDLNNDGNVDVVVADTWNDNVMVFMGRGDGTFRNQMTFATGTDPLRPTIADFNNDGIFDLTVVNQTGGSGAAISILIGRGDGTFNPQYSLAAVAGFHKEVNTGDLNGDGNLDIVLTTETSGQVLTYLGNGNGTFGSPTAYAMGGNPWATVIADFNGDGKNDLATALNTDNRVAVRLGYGDGSFQGVRSYQVGTVPDHINSADFNGDGILDLVTNNSNNLSILLGVGDGTFGAQTSISAGGGYYGLGRLPLKDFNNDGVVDIALAHTAANEVSLMLGNHRAGIGSQLDFKLTTQVEAREAMKQFSNNLNALTQQRATIGAFQSRINVSVATLSATTENYASAESRIRDADMAVEAAEAARLSIVQQAAQSILAQANQQPAIAIRLLSR